MKRLVLLALIGSLLTAATGCIFVDGHRHGRRRHCGTDVRVVYTSGGHCHR